MDEPIIAIVEEMAARYRDMMNEIHEAEIHNYATPQSVFDSELLAYFSDEPDAHYDVEVALEQHRDPFVRISTTSSALDKGEARADNIVADSKVATASSANSTTQNTPSTDSKDKISYPPSAYSCLESNINPNTIDLNKVGVLYEFMHYFYVIFETPCENRKKSTVTRCGFTPRWNMGRYLAIEWKMLEKCEIGLGLFGTGALGVDTGKREWNAHGGKMQRMRTRCLETARELAVYLTEKEDLDLDQATTEDIKGYLGHALSRATGKADAEWKVKEQEETEDGDKFIEEFMLFEE